MTAVDSLYKALLPYEAHIRFLREEPMSRHTTFRIGGPAEVFLETDADAPLADILACIRETEMPLYVIGRGSNLLVQDKGVRGVVLCTGRMNHITVSDTEIHAEAGVSLAALARTALEHGLTGAEFAAGIPGSLGGAVFMNAGAYDGQMADVVTSSTYFDTRASVLGETEGAAHAFGYRDSIYKRHREQIILGATLRLRQGDSQRIREKMDDFAARRSDKQPLEYPSAGSTFKRPEGHFAGALIEQAGLKGFSIGGAQVSEKHAGFCINRGGATAEDMHHLIEEVQRQVYESTGVQLECEVQFL